MPLIFENCYAPSPRHRVRVCFDRLDEPGDGSDLIIKFAVHCDRRPIQHCFGRNMSEPRVADVNGQVELAQTSPPVFSSCPPAGLRFIDPEDCDGSWSATWRNCAVEAAGGLGDQPGKGELARARYAPGRAIALRARRPRAWRRASASAARCGRACPADPWHEHPAISLPSLSVLGT